MAGHARWRGRRTSAIALAVLIACSASRNIAAAQGACPKEATAGKGLVMTSPDGRRGEVTWLDGGRVRIVEQKPSAPKSFPRETVAVRGLIATELAWPGSRAQLELEAPADGIFPLAPGRQHELAYVASRAGQPPVKAMLTVAVLEALQHTIGKCTYDALLVGNNSVFEDGTRTPERYDVYVPALQVVVKSTMFAAASHGLLEQESFEFETIASK